MAGGAAPRLQVQHGDAEEEAGSLLHAEDHGFRHNDEVETHRASILGLYEARVRYDIKYVLIYVLKTLNYTIKFHRRKTLGRHFSHWNLCALYCRTVVVLPKAKSGLHPRVIVIRPGAYDPSVNTVAELMCILYYMVQV